METAENDLESARILLEAGQHANAAFHLQQAGEKAMKALLLHRDVRRHTSTTLECMLALEQVGVTFPPDFDARLRRLDPCANHARYPNRGGPPEKFYNRAIVEELLECCQRVMEFVRSRLS